MSGPVTDVNNLRTLDALDIPGWEEAHALMSDFAGKVISGEYKSSNRIIPFVITGNQGVGKSSVARKIAPLLVELGLLQTRAVIKVDPFNFMGHHMDHAQDTLRDMMDKARGGMLLVDEAHELYVDSDELSKELREITFDTILPVLGEALDNEGDSRSAIVICGYPAQMERMLEEYPELAVAVEGRIIRIPDTSPEIIGSRFMENVMIMRYSIVDGTVEGKSLGGFFRNMFDDRDERFFANFRMARRMAELVCNNARSRGSDTISIEDFGEYAKYFD